MRFLRTIHPALGFLLLGLVVSSAVEGGESTWFARDWQIDDGLPNNTVVGIAQTPDGYLWLGTPAGLVRFDGVHFHEFSPTNIVQPSTKGNRGILTMIGSRDGGLRLAMDRGAIVLLNPEGARAFMPGTANQNVPDETPYQLLEAGDGALWVTYRSGSVCRISQGRVTRFNSSVGLPDGQHLCALASDQQGRLWFAKGRTFGEFRDGRFHTHCSVSRPISRLIPARKGGVWLGAGSHLMKYEESGAVNDFGEFSPENQGAGPTVLLEDRAGTVWIGTAYSGVVLFDGTSFEAVKTTHRDILGLMEDREGNVWVGTAGGGLNRIRPRAVVLEGTESGLPFETVQSLCEDRESVIWAVTQSGLLARRVAGRWQKFSPTPGWTAEATCVTADPSGAIWIGTRAHGLFCWHDNRLVDWGRTNDLVGKTIHTLLVSRAGDVWIGEENNNAVQRLRAGTLTTLQTQPGEDLRVVRAMTEDASGTIWVGTSRGLLMRADGDRLVNESGRAKTQPISLRCLSATADGSVWVGYAGSGGGGVGRFKDGKLAIIGTEQGLFDDYLSHIVADGQGWLWFGGDRGIFKVRQQELDDLAEGRVSRVRSIHYGRGEGLPSLQGTTGVAPAAMRSRDGRIWIPMRTALAVVHPDRLGEGSEPPPVLLHRVAVDEQRTVAFYGGVVPQPGTGPDAPLDLRQTDATLRLPPGHRRVQFEFSALSFTAPENVHFRYRLDDIDDDWGAVKSERSATYLPLSAGKYVFRVIACSSDGVWAEEEEGAALSFIVLPFFWETWWFRSLLLAAFTLSIVAIVRYVSFRRLRLQMRHLEQQAALHKERARIAKDIHDDLGASLTQIAFLGELARQDHATPEKATERVEKISGTARQVIKSLDEIVWAVNPRNDTLAHLIDYAGQFAVDYLRVAGIRCRLDLPAHVPAREVSTDVRHNLFLLVKEAIHNVVKHAHASEVWLRVATSETHLRMSVEDDGRGFDQPPDDPGADGLRNMRQRIADIGGECQVESRPGAGTKVVVEVPWPAD